MPKLVDLKSALDQPCHGVIILDLDSCCLELGGTEEWISGGVVSMVDVTASF